MKTMRCFPLSIKANVYTKSITNDNFMKLGLTKAKKKTRIREKTKTKKKKSRSRILSDGNLKGDMNLWIGIEGELKKKSFS